ncbi:OLC1v1037869C1 [Oldenlandia corymbosa var. corymbosa]|uniref:Germin-like protein n=1 Tax=Oldenlandia corymbosa var. corymbosa TaxID=529605 RepID=A0AAV1D0N8_OLDCO|nr:OLC1v1037869C1 [Oldenlandia corymbosa var. corymbosa]
MKMFIYTFLFFSLLATIAFTTEASVVDFCVADPSLPNGPAGFSCKNPSQVVAEDFFYSLAGKGDTSNIFRWNASFAFASTFAGVNGLGISIARSDIEVGGVIPFHSHPDASEIILVTKGTITVGFVASTFGNRVYSQTLRKGNIFVFPQGLLHFTYNIGKIPAVAFSSFSSDNPTGQITDYALFQNDLLTEIVSNGTFISPREVKRLKRLFGGTN